LALIGFAATTVLAAKGNGDGVATTVTIDTWPGGLEGEVRSPVPGRCADGRRVVVYRVLGKQPDPGRDERVGDVRAKGGAGTFGWSVEADGPGRFYARAQGKNGCRAARSPVVGSGGLGGSATTADYQLCGTYISEALGTICRIENLTYRTFASYGEQVCVWVKDPTQNRCPSNSSGQYPWASETGGAETRWKPDGGGRELEFESTQRDRKDAKGASVVATLVGTLPAFDSQRFTVTDALAPNEGDKDAGGDHFYTPNLPGQLVGEVGGPLKMEYGPSTKGTAFTFNGYLYLKR
jgi:hypothetical protein